VQGSSPPRHLGLRALLGAAALSATFFGGAQRGIARAQDSQSSGDAAEACFSAAERAQPLLRQRRLREARALLESCARDTCPRAARTDCRQWLAEAADAQPSIVIVAHEVRGKEAPREVSGVRAVIDEALVVDRVDATPIVIDPGRHRLRLEREGAEPLVQDIEVHEGEKGRVIDLYWRQAETVVPTRPVPASVWVTGTLGIVAVGVGATFEGLGLSKRPDLDACKPSCPSSQVSAARTQTAVGDVALGAGIVFLGSALVLYLARPVIEEPAPSNETSWVFGVTPGGFYAGARGTL
jgi:hypothetical protein